MTFQPLPFLLKGLTPELETKAFLELGETPKVRNNALEELKELIKKKSNFEPFMENIFLMSFLRWSKFNVQKAFKALYDFYRLKEKHSGVYLDVKPSDLVNVLELNHLTVMPLRDPDGCNLGILRLGYHDLKAFTAEKLYAAVLCMGLATNDIEAFQVSGVVLICDFKNLSFEMLQSLAHPYQLYFLVEVLRCLPSRIKSIHMVNVPKFFNTLYSMLKILFPKKLLKRVFIHTNDFTEFHKHVPPEILPEELGGTLGPIDNAKYINFFLGKQHYIEQINSGTLKSELYYD
ncbi:alpha-tocopherol transfer protein-like [Stegodyphus dumicola]|uniref:alpha-tocopherol transfer protein-like n=1 Tax=Stegodyphus dumicola TaxID=202533 RepID=UPI0015AE512A|nr:alpha-tocopherol transfer protein-like [Stegodyphus dumicola]